MSRERALRIIKNAFSPAAMFWLIAVWVLFYSTLAIWTKEAFGTYMARLPGQPLLQAPLVAFILVAAVNYFYYAAARVRASWISAPLWLLAPAGVLLFLAGFYISAAFSSSGKIYVAKDSTVQPPWQASPLVVSKVDTGLREEIIDMGAGEGLIFSLSPRLYLDGGTIRHEVGVFPPTRVGDTYYHIMDFGLAPGVRVSRDDAVLIDGYVNLRILPPGIRDSFEIIPLPYRFAIRMLPEREVFKGRAKLGVYRPDSHLYNVVIEKGQEIVFEGDSSGPIELDGLTISFYEPDYWFWLEGARNPGYMVLAAGLVLLATGLPLLLIAMVFRVLGSFGGAAGAGSSRLP